MPNPVNNGSTTSGNPDNRSTTPGNPDNRSATPDNPDNRSATPDNPDNRSATPDNPDNTPGDDSFSITDEGDAGMDDVQTSVLLAAVQEELPPFSGLEMEGDVVEEVVYDSAGEVVGSNIARNLVVPTSNKQNSDTQMSKEECVALMAARILKLPLPSLTGNVGQATMEAEGVSSGSDDDVILIEGPVNNNAKETVAKGKSPFTVQRPSTLSKLLVGTEWPAPRHHLDSELGSEQSNPQQGATAVKNKSPVKKPMIQKSSPPNERGQGAKRPAPRRHLRSELDSDGDGQSNPQQGVKNKSPVNKQTVHKPPEHGQGAKLPAPDSELDSDGGEQSNPYQGATAVKNKSPVKKQTVQKPSPQTERRQVVKRPAPKRCLDSELDSDGDEQSNPQWRATAVKKKSPVKKQKPRRQVAKRPAPRRLDSELDSGGGEQSNPQRRTTAVKKKSPVKKQKPRRQVAKRPAPRRLDSELDSGGGEQSKDQKQGPTAVKNKPPVKKQIFQKQTGRGRGTKRPAPRCRLDSELDSDSDDPQQGALLESPVKKQMVTRRGQGTKRPALRRHLDSELDSDSSEQSDGKDPQWEPMGKKVVGETGRAYDYVRIGDLKPGDDKKNVFGVVQFFKPIFQTRGTDYCCVLTIVDESSQPTGLKCNLFQRNPERLPQIQCVGDIVCIHRLKIQEYNSERQGYGQKFTSSICFDGRTTAEVVPRTGSDSYTLTKKEKERVRELREWSATQGELAANARLCKLTDVQSNVYFDLLCQIISTTNCKDHECIVLTVWDGTLLHLPRKECDYSHYTSVTDHSLRIAAKELTTDIVIYECHSAFFRSKPGQLVRLHNVHANPVSGFNALGDRQVYTELCIHRGTQCGSGVSGISVLPEEDVDCVRLKAQLGKALERSSETSQQQSAETSKQPTERKLLPKSATIALHPRVAFTPISDILSHGKVPYAFRCRAKVVCIIPQCIEELIQIRCPVCCYRVAAMPRSQADMNSTVGKPCPKCSSSGSKTGGTVSNLSLCYIFRLLLEDESGFMHVVVAEEDANKFLPDLPPRNFYLEQDQRRKLLDRLYYLTGGKDPFIQQAPGTCLDKFRPWMECCVKSYHKIGSSKGKVFFKVFDTILNFEEPHEELNDNETQP